MAQRDDDDACWSQLGAGLGIDTCREGGSPGLPEASAPPATPDTPLGQKVD